MRSRTAGLTQLELLVALALMSLMAMLTISGMGFVQRASNSGVLYSATTEQFLAQEQLRRWSEQVPSQNFTLDKQKLFSGHETAFEFRAILNDGVFWPGALVSVRVMLDDAESAPDLVMIARGVSEGSRQPIETRTTLAESPTELSITYFGKPNGWSKTWSDLNVPVLVKIEWNQQTGKAAPPLTLRLAWEDRQRFKSLSSLVPPG